jgi:hypothetical protein
MLLIFSSYQNKNFMISLERMKCSKLSHATLPLRIYSFFADEEVFRPHPRFHRPGNRPATAQRSRGPARDRHVRHQARIRLQDRTLRTQVSNRNHVPTTFISLECIFVCTVAGSYVDVPNSSLLKCSLLTVEARVRFPALTCQSLGTSSLG